MNRFSSRKQDISSFLQKRLCDAKKYDRIAGYFSSSLLTLIDEIPENLEIRIICNSDLNPNDVKVGKEAAVLRAWNLENPHLMVMKHGDRAKDCFSKLSQYIDSGNLKIKVMPIKDFGLLHGKAGVITNKDDSKTCFMGSVNETFSGWGKNYEIVWEDDTKESIDWVQNEFNDLWNHEFACSLTDAVAVIKDIKRLANRTEIIEFSKPESALIECPVYRQDCGLRDYQKYFIDLVYKQHKLGGARYILADGVGLGKTVQLGAAAKLIALCEKEPVLIICPKTLMEQWQSSLMSMLDMPSAIWNGNVWIDENNIEHPNGIRHSPRRVAIISQSRIISETKDIESIKNMKFSLIVVDEAHKARKIGKDDKDLKPNNLYKFLCDMSLNCKSMLLATATPVQLSNFELHDLMSILAEGNDYVLGNLNSKWRNRDIIETISNYDGDISKIQPAYITNPFPYSESEHDSHFKHFGHEQFDKVVGVLEKGDEAKNRIKRKILTALHPFIRRTIKRTRADVEKDVVQIKIDYKSIQIPSDDLTDVFELTREFCKTLISKGHGFVSSLLLRRLCSSLKSGLKTAEKMLDNKFNGDNLDEIDDDISTFDLTNCTEMLGEIKAKLDKIEDPKLKKVEELVKEHKENGIILFSQFFDTVEEFAEHVSTKYPDERIALYSSEDKSFIYKNGVRNHIARSMIKELVSEREINIMFGTDAASEGLNLQTMQTLVNIDLPWNPSRLEQRKGRIQRIGQRAECINIYYLQYKDSIDDKVFAKLSERLQGQHDLFDELPDCFEDVWVNCIKDIKTGLDSFAHDIDKSKEKCKLNQSFKDRYTDPKRNGSTLNWESCSEVLSAIQAKNILMQEW